MGVDMGQYATLHQLVADCRVVPLAELPSTADVQEQPLRSCCGGTRAERIATSSMPPWRRDLRFITIVHVVYSIH